MAGSPIKTADAEKLRDAWLLHEQRGGNVADFAKRLGVRKANALAKRRRVERALDITLPTFSGSATQQAKLRAAEALDGFGSAQFQAEQPPTDDIPIEELVRRRLQDTGRTLKAKDAAELVNVRLNVSGPYAVALIGDPHIDNPGANLALLLRHTDLIRETEGMYAICVGDLQDGWIGRLARLWAHQGIKARDSQRLVDWWLQQFGGSLVALVNGNHDLWLHGLGGADPVAWIVATLGAVSQRHGVRLALTQQDGHRITINARHDYPGRSQFNPAHGPVKSLLWGNRDDVAVAGHTHVYGYSCLLDPDTRKPMHAVRLGSYKWADEYAAEMGLKDNNVSECAVLIVRPDEPDPRHRTIIVQDPFLAARMLRALREDWSHGRGSEHGHDTGNQAKGARARSRPSRRAAKAGRASRKR